jgi:tetraacyldisaccharide 4'-kinase
MRAPDFWWSVKPSPLGRLMTALLTPFSALYGRAVVRRMGQPGSKVNAPVICVGNFVAGGAGKTPTALALAKWLKRSGETPYFLSRGYGGALSADGGAHLVDQRRHCAAEAGGASMIVMDDGLQNPSLRRDFTLAVIDGAVGFGNGRLIPAGPLRAPLDLQLRVTSAGLVIGEGQPGEKAAARLIAAGKPVFHGRLAPDANAALHVLGARVVAFAGIGRPQKFFESLQACGARVVARHAFADHHHYRLAEITALQRQAEALDALLVTTEKDMVKITSFLPLLRPKLPQPEALPVVLVVDEAEELQRLVRDALANCRAAGRFSGQVDI